ncbi:MAG: GlmU family protein [Cyclobacteriaceae bacterium]
MSITLFDVPASRKRLLPFTYTRPISEIRTGILTIREKWEKHLKDKISVLTETYLHGKFPPGVLSESELMINSVFCPDEHLVKTITELEGGEALYINETLVACKLTADATFGHPDKFRRINYDKIPTSIDRVWHIFQANGDQIRKDFALLTKGRKSQPIGDPHTVVYHPDNVFIEEGATIRAAVINAEDGPVYIGKNSRVHEGCLIKGPFALCEASHVNMGAKMKGDNTIGPHSKVGGEISNSVIFGYSNKGHDGFLGNSVIGEWCNLGADTNSSNLKNNYSMVKVWNYESENLDNTNLQFCGLLMGDHSKSGINTMFNTGTVVGVSANVYGGDFPPKFIPSFSWGGSNGFTTFRKDKALEMCRAVMGRRNVELTDADEDILTYILEVSSAYRSREVKQ